MTKQEPHTCDVCGEMFYVPQDPLRKMKVYENEKEELDYDLCLDCHDKLMKWILAMREATMISVSVEKTAEGEKP